MSLPPSDADWYRDAILASSRGVLHLGAHTGQEATVYASYHLPVVWVEGDPAVYQALQRHLAPFKNQRAICALVSDHQSNHTDFFVSEQSGLQSSLFPVGSAMAKLFPAVKMRETIKLPTVTVTDLLAQHELPIATLDYVVLDVQGAELKVLAGMVGILPQVKYLTVEASTVDLYRGGVLLPELTCFLRQHGFVCRVPLPPGTVHGDTIWENTSLHKWHSQLGQDQWVIEDVFAGKKNGFFIDVGAADGVLLSNTYALEHYYNWRGLCIEPGLSGSLLSSSRQCAISRACVAGESRQTVTFAEAGLLSGMVHTFDHFASDGRTNWRQQAPKHVLVTQRLDEVLADNQCPPLIDYLSLDTEGSEYDILRSFPFKKYTILSLTVEHNFQEPQRTQVYELLVKNGFARAKPVQWEDWYVNRRAVV